MLVKTLLQSFKTSKFCFNFREYRSEINNMKFPKKNQDSQQSFNGSKKLKIFYFT